MTDAAARATGRQIQTLDALTPEQAGVPTYGGQRRVPGLRREEVAHLAGVSTDYYSKLERGNTQGVSAEVLEAIARALQLDDTERQHLMDLVEVVAVIQVSEDQQFQHQPEDQRSRQRQREAGEEAAGHGSEGCDEIGADHVLDAMREIDEIHHAKHQRQAGGDQEQDQPELQAVKNLDEGKGESHAVGYQN